jgi:putative transcriptional regulator
MTDESNRSMPSELGDPELGTRLSALRLQAGLTQTEVAERIGVSRQHVSNMETAITSPTVRVLHDYLRVCGTDLAEFFYGPLPADQTPRQREYHRKLQALLENSTISPVITKVLDSFMTSMQSSLTAIVQPVRVQARLSRVHNFKKDRERK